MVMDMGCGLHCHIVVVGKCTRVKKSQGGLVSGRATQELDKKILGRNDGELDPTGEGGKATHTACPSHVT